MDRKTNRLIHSLSPYLLQHAHNPVDWYPWGEEALEKARKEDRPIFLSIGYSTCHWCHVMERESFEDEEVAKGMNKVFVSIKVDREERPDLDAIYMKACTLATGRGGWPLTVVMTPDLKPFFLGTYIPKTSRWGSLGMMDLIEQVKEIWGSRREDALTTSSNIVEALGSILPKGPGADLDQSVIVEAVNRFKGSYDEINGGFNGSPKFPSPHNGLLLLRYWKRTGDQRCLEMVKGTLDKMIQGGIHDHVGGGFHRYSTDEAWNQPHFEKMLYDQAMISILLLEAYQSTNEGRYAKAARSTLEYVMNDLSDKHGGFHSAEDADSEGEEGKFYVWSNEELKGILSDEEFMLLCSEFDIREEGNFREEGTGVKLGLNVLISKYDSGMKLRDNSDRLETDKRVNDLLKKLKDVRDRRIRPLKDDKVLSDWNGMMISALSKASRVLKDPAYVERAVMTADFILQTMTDRTGKLIHRYRTGKSNIDGFLEDYAYVIQGFLDLYEATFDPSFLREALKFNGIVMKEFLDEENGGFFQTSSRSEKVLIRLKESYDGAIPSGNSVQMMNLLRIGRITGDMSLMEKANGIGRAFSFDVNKNPRVYSYLLCALDMAIGPSSEITISGDRTDPLTIEMIDIVNSRYDPNAILLLNDGGDLNEIVPDIDDYPAIDGKPTAYVCTGNKCEIPVTDPNTLKEHIFSK